MEADTNLAEELLLQELVLQEDRFQEELTKRIDHLQCCMKCHCKSMRLIPSFTWV